MMVMMGIAQMFAMSHSTIRNNARFLSDRMAYELDLTPMQYDDIYEINYDFLYAINRIMPDVVFGYGDAIRHYYDLLDYRNDDIRYVLTMRQYQKFIMTEHFYRPIYSTGKDWMLRVHTIYNNHTFFYFDAPSVFKHYKGGHSHHAYGPDYYAHRYEHQMHDRYMDHYKFHDQPGHKDMGRKDFGERRLERNNPQHNAINNYKNRNQQNRTQDNRYRDNSGNQESPKINNRGQNNGKGNGQNNGKGNNQTRTQSGSNSQTRTQSGSANGNASTGNGGTRVQSGRR